MWSSEPESVLFDDDSSGLPPDARHVAEAFKQLGKSLGMTTSQAAGIAGHSTRVGAAQDLVAEGFDLPGIMHSGGWSSSTMAALDTPELRARQNAMARLNHGRFGELRSGSIAFASTSVNHPFG